MSSGVTADLFFMQTLATNISSVGENDKNYSLEPKTVTIENFRTKLGSESITLDTAGFQLFSNYPTQSKGYYNESIALLKEITGASRVVIFDHTIRRRCPGESGESPDKRQPATTIHIDQTFEAAVARVHRHLPQARRSWVTGQAVDQEKDVVPVDLIDSSGRKRGVYGIKYNERQRWGYFKDTRPDKFILIKCNESLQDGSVALYTPHTAFADPTTPEGTLLRQSIEIRALVFYD
ncbi:hypothetical protein F5146DRAFT_1049700 [Armillaria mellea]|nr:hypothetical protein F5146DRAFT_1049700 [Armillaria mellea]